MSFSFQGPNEMPIIREAQNMMNNGGGGNLGYFQGRQKKKEDNNPSIFNTDEEDTFTLSSDAAKEDIPEDTSDNVSVKDKIKCFFKKLGGSEK